MIRRPPRSTLDRSSAASDVYKRQVLRGEAPYLEAPPVVPAPAALPPAERRRTGQIVKLSLAVGFEAVAASALDPAGLATVFSSSGADGDEMLVRNAKGGWDSLLKYGPEDTQTTGPLVIEGEGRTALPQGGRGGGQQRGPTGQATRLSHFFRPGRAP